MCQKNVHISVRSASIRRGDAVQIPRSFSLVFSVEMVHPSETGPSNNMEVQFIPLFGIRPGGYPLP